MPRTFIKTLLVTVLALPLAFTAATASAADKPCTLKPEHPAVKEACGKGGIEAAKKLMKEMVKAGKKEKLKFECESCHKDLEKYEATKNSAEDFKKLVAAWEKHKK